jgi:branched-chain amino acid transport system substrate-binding protein
LLDPHAYGCILPEEEVQAIRPIWFLPMTLLLLLTALWAASCVEATPSPSTLSTTPATQPPIEVTRIVERLVTPTPAPTTPACTRGALADAPDVVIGALAPLSRPGALLTGFAMQTAFSLAVDDLNASGGIGGKPVRLVTYDTANSAELGAHYAERLITLDCAAVLVGVHHAPVGVAVKETAHRLGVPVIFSAAYTDSLTSDHYPEVFRINPTFSMIAQMPGDWLAEVGDYNQDGRQVAVVIMANNESHNLDAETVLWLSQLGFQVETQQVELPATDFSSTIARLVALDQTPDAVLLALSGDAALTLQAQMETAGVGPDQGTLIISNSSALNDAVFWQQVPEGRFTVVPRLGAWPSTVTPLGAQFAEKFRPYFDRWPELHAFLAYDAVLLAADAIGRAESLESGAIIAALESSDIELASGRYHFPYAGDRAPDGIETPAYWWHQWLDAPLLYLQYSEVGQSASEAPIIWPESYRTVDTPVLSGSATPP